MVVLYLWLQFGSSVLGSLFFSGGAAGIAYVIYRCVSLNQGHEQFLCDMRDQLRTGTGGPLTSEEAHRTMAALRRLVAKEKNT